MTGPEFPPFSAAREGWTIQLQDHEGGWQSEVRLVSDPTPCLHLCGGLTALVVLPSGARVPYHASADHLMQVLSQGDGIDQARERLASGVEPERSRQEYEREKADDLRDGGA